MNRDIIVKLEELAGKDAVKQDADMAEYTSFRAGGKAAVLVEPDSVSSLRDILRLLHREKHEHFVLGNGTNVLFKDGGYDGVVVRIGKPFEHIRTEGVRLICGSGALLASVSKEALAKGLTGLEFASGIPGSVGGAVFMNAGAYGGEIKDVLVSARMISRDGEREYTLSAEELDLSYRHSILHETGDIVVEAEFKLAEGDRDAIKAEMAELTKKRNAKQPVQYPSAGSTFKRPEGYFAGKLIQDAGCKGLQVGGAQVSELHSGFVINKGGATASDILQLMEIVQAKVLNDFGVMLEPEVRIIG
ncbi:MAG: UDP-N-acetylmuramate dehydrogenase [Firmicutes bacterium]|nr:UDP-N-acetylmuramate dehydrogenase [Bacillota bacterium]